MEKSITVRILGRSYSLRVSPEDEELTRTIATYVDEKMTAFRSAFPKQPEITTAVIAAMAIAEELFSAREANNRIVHDADAEINALAELLGDALNGSANGVSSNTRASSDSEKQE